MGRDPPSSIGCMRWTTSECYKLSDDRKVRFAKLKLIGRANLFWKSTEAQQRQPPITDWIEMKKFLSNKYFPHSYKSDRLEAMERKKKLKVMQKKRT